MTELTDFYASLVDRLRLDDSYLTTDIPVSVRRLVKALLRDYHFPKSIRKTVYANVDEGNQSYTLPSDFKKQLLVCFMDDTDSSAPTFSEPLTRREGFVSPDSDGAPRHYWIEGTSLWTDITVPADSPHTNFIIVYESNDVDYNLGWLLADFEDVLFSYCMCRLSAEFNKTELLQSWAALWQGDRTAFAIYLNELEFEGSELLMRAALPAPSARYPVTGHP